MSVEAQGRETAEFVEAPLKVVQALRDLEVAVRQDHRSDSDTGEYPFKASCPTCAALKALDDARVSLGASR